MNTQFTRVGGAYVRCDLKSYEPKKDRILPFDPLSSERKTLILCEAPGERIPAIHLQRVPIGAWLLGLWEGSETGNYVHLLYHRLPSRKATPSWELWRCENGIWEICDERITTNPRMADRSWWLLNTHV